MSPDNLEVQRRGYEHFLARADGRSVAPQEEARRGAIVKPPPG
ncbi:MAG: hypothetical protein ACRDMH_05475 [Solirubrobacterales bacterium]